ncbi:Bifunctional hemolysin/adenylate cyclase precursor [Shimia sp. SK013]|uniref:Hint domain-containing protein n=1 Tax=Shimia sp. SK013 TaxID=1389006 RepID=UPI0006CCEE42|nr:Hint domain-containing protein [Shimia sp. SK013]KPA21438.1 Bifunctional hemolysin/adenylate cyclase precursor [Shimia sp. SK013]
MATLTGYSLYWDENGDGLGASDGISGGSETCPIYTDSDFPLGSGSVNYPTTLGTVSGVFYEYAGDTYFVPDDDTGFPPWEAGTVTSFTEAIKGSTGNDDLTGTTDRDVIHDSDQNLYNQTGDDRISAGSGDDTVVFGDGNDTIRGEDGNDQIGSWSFGSGNNLIEGGAGDDSIIGGSGDDQIIGGEGDDWMAGAGGRDTMDGGDGYDQFWVTDDHDYADITGGEGFVDWDIVGFGNWATNSGVNVTFSGDEAGSFAFQDTSTSGVFQEIEHIIGTDNGDNIDASGNSRGLTLEGRGGDDSIIGGSGDDYISGGRGADTLTGGLGSDTLVGGDGNDLFVVHDSDETTDVHGEGWWDIIQFQDEGTGEGAVVTYEGDTYGTYSIGGAAGNFSSIEQTETTRNDDIVDASASNWTAVTSMLDGDDTFLGSGGDDRVWAGDGQDYVDAGAGDDEIYGESDDDTLLGGDGHDSIYGGEGADSIVAGQGNDLVDAGAGHDTVDGGSGQDLIYGGDGDDVLGGGSGDDTLIADAGNDTLGGGAGSDVLKGGAGDDVFVIANNGGYDVVDDFRMDGTEHDQLDVTGLTNASGNPVTVGDVTVLDDGNGNAVLTFPGGEGIQLNGIAPATLSIPTLVSMGIPCFAGGTRIRTPSGDVPIENLNVGDLVQTLDNGMQPVLWVGRRHLTQADLAENPKLQPVRIRAGSLGNERDLIVSPQHGIVTTHSGESPALARAIHLARDGGPGFRVARGIKSVTYYHLMFESHEIIIAENAPSESFYPGPMALNALAPAERAEVAALFPELLANLGALEVYGPTARRFLIRKEITRDVAEKFSPARAFG